MFSHFWKKRSIMSKQVEKRNMEMKTLEKNQMEMLDPKSRTSEMKNHHMGFAADWRWQRRKSVN